ncbi:MAG: carbohydrate kinase family protein [Candidatus Pacebacteria bacterium]|nr:carbohydrate kinase family protein [Candidatus Paceibacterota bacterium]
MVFDVITIGSATRDGFFKGIDFLPVEGECFIANKGICLPLGAKIRVPQVYFLTGGSAVNTAVSFVRQGLKTAIICRVGDDVSGETIIREQKEEGIDIKFIQKDYSSPTAYSVIFLTSSGERTILSYKGCAERLTAWEIPWKKIKTRWICIGSLGQERNILKEIIQFAVSSKIKLAINPGWQELEWLKKNPKWIDKFEIFICNQEEAAYFTGIPYNKEKQVFKKLDNLVKGVVVMTKGQNGSTISNGEYLWKVGVFHKKAVDTTGAGDAFTSGFVSVFVKNKKINNQIIEEAIRVGNANASSVVKYIGAKPGILFKKDFKQSRFRRSNLKIKKILFKGNK